MSWSGLPPSLVLVLGAGVAAVIVTLYAVRWRLPRRIVGTTRFWLAAQAKGDGAGRLGPLEHLISFLLQVAIAGCIVLAVAQPRFACQSPGGRAVMVVLDRSASMGAEDGVESRLARARRRVIGRLGTLAATDRVGLVLAGGTPEVAVPLGSDPAPVRAAAARAAMVGNAGRLADAVARACALVHGLAPASLVVVTDGAEPIGDCDGVELEVEAVGVDRANVGITAFAAAVPPADPRHAEAFVEVLNASAQAAEVELRLDLEGSLQRVARLQLGPGQQLRQVFIDLPADRPDGQGRLQARLSQIRFADGSRDAFAADDRAYALLPRRAALRVALVGRSAPLELVLGANPRYAISPRPAADGNADVTVIAGPVDAPLPPGRYLLVDARGAGAPVAAGPRIAAPRITWWREEHPVLRGAVVSDLLIGEASRLQLPAAAAPLLGSVETTLAYALDDGVRRVVGLGFPLESSNLPLRVGFPVLVYNAIDWLVSARPDPLGLASDRAVELVAADGTRRTLEPIDGHIPVDWLAPGFFEVRRDGQRWTELAVSVADPGETVLRPKLQPVRASAGRVRDSEPARGLLALALALVLIEWLTYHRRKTV